MGDNCDCYYEKICGSDGKETVCNSGNLGLIPELRRSPGEGNCYPLQYSGLENSMDCIACGRRVGHDKRLSLHFRISKFSKMTGYELNIYVNKSQLYLLNFQ